MCIRDSSQTLLTRLGGSVSSGRTLLWILLTLLGLSQVIFDHLKRPGKGTIYSLRLRDSRKTDGKSESNQSQVSQLSEPFSSSDSSLKMSAEGFCLLHKRMIHTNHGELLRIFDTYCRVWKAGGQATLTTSTEGGLLKANLDIQLG